MLYSVKRNNTVLKCLKQKDHTDELKGLNMYLNVQNSRNKQNANTISVYKVLITLTSINDRGTIGRRRKVSISRS